MHVKCASFAVACGYMHFFLIVWFIVINDYFLYKKGQYCVYFIQLLSSWPNLCSNMDDIVVQAGSWF